MKKLIVLAFLLCPQNTAREFPAGKLRIDLVPGLRVWLEREDQCAKIDGRAIPCPRGPTRYFVSHWDHGHVPFFPPSGIACLDGEKPPFRFQAWRKIPACIADAGIHIAVRGRPGWDGNLASRAFFLRRSRVLVLADLLPEKLEVHARFLRALRPAWIVLPRSGALGKKESAWLRSLKPRFGFISAVPRERNFDPGKKILLRLTDWGNLVFPTE